MILKTLIKLQIINKRDIQIHKLLNWNSRITLIISHQMIAKILYNIIL